MQVEFKRIPDVHAAVVIGSRGDTYDVAMRLIPQYREGAKKRGVETRGVLITTVAGLYPGDPVWNVDLVAFLLVARDKEGASHLHTICAEMRANGAVVVHHDLSALAQTPGGQLFTVVNHPLRGFEELRDESCPECAKCSDPAPLFAYLGATFLAGAGGEDGPKVWSAPEGSPAASAGLRQHDRITGIGGVDVYSIGDVDDAVDAYRPGERVRVDFVRCGIKRFTFVVLGGRA